jgi:pimeloyl-ACP methyl ester carboxylesterase
MTGWVEKRAGEIEYLERQGDGEALVLLHGIGSHAASFTGVLDHLAPGRRVIAWNAPGYGGSAPLAEDWPEAGDYARSLERFADALSLSRMTLMGHSLGALMAAAFATAHRERVGRLILASPALGHGVRRGGGLSPAAQGRIDDLTRQGPEAFARARAPRLVHDPDANPAIVAAVAAAMARVTMPGYAQAVRMLASGQLLDDAGRLTLPTDVIVGANDLVTPPDGASRAHAALRGKARGRLIIVPEAGHAIYLQTPEAFAAVLAVQPETAG